MATLVKIGKLYCGPQLRWPQCLIRQGPFPIFYFLCPGDRALKGHPCPWNRLSEWLENLLWGLTVSAVSPPCPTPPTWASRSKPLASIRFRLKNSALGPERVMTTCYLVNENHWNSLSHLATVPRMLTLSAGNPEGEEGVAISDIMTGTTSHLLTTASLNLNIVLRP